MALTNPTPIVTATSNALLACASITTGLGITTVAQVYYGTPYLVPIAANLPALVIERTRYHGVRSGYNSATVASTTITGQVDVMIYVAPTDIGSLDTLMESLVDDLIAQGGANLNIVAVDVAPVALPKQGALASNDAGQPGMSGGAFCTLLVSLMWE